MGKRQLEFTLQLELAPGKALRRGSIYADTHYLRQVRAQWWFARMRQVVEGSLDQRRNQTSVS